MLFFFMLPFWMFGIPLYLAAAIRREYPHLTTLPAALILGAISTMTALAYRSCQIGTWRAFFDASYPATIVYRGFPFAWLGWSMWDVSFEPMAHLFLDLLVWTIVAVCGLYLFSFLQVIVQLKMARADRLLIIGVVMAVLPLGIASIASGRGC